MKKQSSVAFIPARSGSKRIPNKNICLIDGHPMLAYSIRAAIDSGVFDSVVCATDSELYADIARYYGAEVPFLREAEISGDKSPDIDWVMWMLNRLLERDREFEIFSILRPTSPFRLPKSILKAWNCFLKEPKADSLRAVQKCKQHPGKMWTIEGNFMAPLLPNKNGATPWHSCQYAALPEIYEQNASLEIAWSRVVFEEKSIAGEVIIPFISENYEGYDINEPEDLWLIERFMQTGEAELPKISLKPYIFQNKLE